MVKYTMLHILLELNHMEKNTLKTIIFIFTINYAAFCVNEKSMNKFDKQKEEE